MAQARSSRQIPLLTLQPLSASGLGRATVEELHSRGAYVAILDLNEDNGQELVQELSKGPSDGSRARFFQVDVSETQSVAAAVNGVVEWTKQTAREIGGVVPAAGVGNPEKMIGRSGEPLSIEGFDFVLGINLRGTVDLLRQLLPTITKNTPLEPDGERGVLVLVASVAAYDGQPGQLSYSASKGAIVSMTLPMARDLAPYGVRVVTIAPGVFESAMTRLMSDKVRKSLEGGMEWPKRMGTAQEFASLAAHVVENVMLNAETIRLDGGIRMSSKM